SDMVERVCPGDAPTGLADHGNELALIVELDGIARTHQRIARPDQARRKAREQRRIFGGLVAAFAGVIAIIQADADDLAWIAQRLQRLDPGEINRSALEQAVGCHLLRRRRLVDQTIERSRIARLALGQPAKSLAVPACCETELAAITERQKVHA